MATITPPPPNLVVSNPPPAAGSGRRIVRRVVRAVTAVAISGVVLLLVLAWTTRSSNPNIVRAVRESAAIRSVLTLLRSPRATLAGEREDRIDVLLLGMGGPGHEGPLLTDTIILATIQPSTRRVVLTSIPRDLLIPLPDGRFVKANAVYALAEANEAGSGGAMTRATMHAMVGRPIAYHVRIDFSGFAGLIDALGGIDLDVERTIDDPQYPIAGRESAPWSERFERLVIPAGRQHVDGALALKYVRSRHALGREGSDFARAARQQRLLLALRDRIRTAGALTNPRNLLALASAWRMHLDTNLSPPELGRLATIADHGDLSTTRVVLTDGPDDLLVARLRGGAYVLEPKEGTYDGIRDRIDRAIRDVREASDASVRAITVQVWNATTIPGLAARTAELLRSDGFTITAIRNAPIRDLDRTVVYHRPTAPPERVDRVRTLLQADTSTAFPAFVDPDQTETDLLILLGATTELSPRPHRIRTVGIRGDDTNL